MPTKSAGTHKARWRQGEYWRPNPLAPQSSWLLRTVGRLGRVEQTCQGLNFKMGPTSAEVWALAPQLGEISHVPILVAGRITGISDKGPHT